MSWITPRDFRYRGSIKDALFLKHVRQKQKQRQRSSENVGQEKTNFERNIYSERLKIIVELCHNQLFHCVSFPYHDTTDMLLSIGTDISFRRNSFLLYSLTTTSGLLLCIFQLIWKTKLERILTPLTSVIASIYCLYNLP